MKKLVILIFTLATLASAIPAIATVNLSFDVARSRAISYPDFSVIYEWEINGYLDTGEETVSRIEWDYPNMLYLDGGNARSRNSGFFGDLYYFVYPDPYLHMAADSVSPTGFKGTSWLINLWGNTGGLDNWTDHCLFGATGLRAFRPNGTQISDVAITPVMLINVPEPSELVVLAGGLLGFSGFIKRRVR